MNNRAIFRAKKIISYMLSAIFAIILSVIIILININLTVLSKSNINKQISKTDYINKTYNTIKETCKNYNMQSGFDESIIEEAIKKQDVEKDINNLVDYLYEGKEFEVNTSNLLERLDTQIEKYIEENNYKVSEENQEAINTFKNQIEKTYKNGIIYSSDVIQKISEPVKKAKALIKTLIIALTICNLILLLLMAKLNLASIGISMLVTGALFILISNYSGTNVAINNILIFNRAFSEFLGSLANQLLHNVLVSGALFAVLGIVCIFIAELVKKTVEIE